VFLGFCFCRDRLLRGQLKHRCRLTFTQDRQQLDPSIREFERIVMRGWLVLVDLPKDSRPVLGCLPVERRGNYGRSGTDNCESRRYSGGADTIADSIMGCLLPAFS
jgi:hypothetical protein